MMGRLVLRWGIMCLMVLVACVARAQDVTATWDFQNRIPASLADVIFNGNAGEVASDRWYGYPCACKVG